MFKVFKRVTGPMSVREWIKLYRKGKFKGKNFKTFLKAGWVDWFCSDYELSERFNNLAHIVNAITNEHILDNYSISFMNQLPARYPLYDVICFNPLNPDVTYFTVECHNKQNQYKYEIFSERNHFEQEDYSNTENGIILVLNHFVPYPYLQGRA